MKKTLLSLFCVLSIGNAFAQDNGQVYTPDLNNSANDYLYGATSYGVSSDGEWVTGYGDEFTMSSFIWNRTTGQFQCITGAPYHTSERDRSECYAVSDDGTVVGGVETHKGYLSPGYWKDGVWTVLDEGYGKVCQATSISSDARIISGQIRRKAQKTYYAYDYDKGEYDYEHPLKKEVELYVPVSWVDGILQNGDELPSWYPDPDLVGSGIFCVHASDDGQSMALKYEHPSGSWAPAALINGELRFFYGEKDIDVNQDNYFFIGETTNVSRNGKFFCGYFAEDGTNAVGFVYDVEKDELTEISGLPSVVLDNGTYYTASAALGEGITGSSADGMVICGYKTKKTVQGSVPYPVIYVQNGIAVVPTGISPQEGCTIGVYGDKEFRLAFDIPVTVDGSKTPSIKPNGIGRTFKGTIAVSETESDVVIITISNDLAKNKTYTLTIPAGAIIAAEGPGSNAELTFKYITDSTGTGVGTLATDPEDDSQVYDMNGRLVLRSATESALQNLPRGIYSVGNKAVVK